MAESTNQKSGFEKWKDYIDSAEGNPKWDVYDCEIQLAVNEFNNHLQNTTNYRRLDWHIIKAMMWVETGAKNPKWSSSPIQIGNPGDPGLRSLLSGNEGGGLILPPILQSRLTIASATATPSHNIRAGIGYLLMRIANFDIRSTPDKDTRIYEITVKFGDSFDRVAKTNGSTVEVMKKLNPTAHVLRPGQTLKYQKAAMKKVITGWKPITTINIAKYYNSGDQLYAKKLDYALEVIRKKKDAICAQQ